MATITSEYLGNLHVTSKHLGSGAIIETDAPLDNGGKGEAFSPTDLVAGALGACAMTIMGKYGETHGVNVDGMRCEITKTMSKEAPRRIAGIEVIFHMPDRAYTDKEKTSLERAAHTCPVHHSLHPETKLDLVFKWAK